MFGTARFESECLFYYVQMTDNECTKVYLPPPDFRVMTPVIAHRDVLRSTVRI